MNHCIIGRVGDRDSGEDGGDEQRGARMAMVARRRRGGLPRRRHHGGAPPLSPFLHGFMGAIPHGDGIHGGGKNMALVAANSWVEVSLKS
jgi:hypothetical protein